ncbi:dephospho-CoA kinase [Blattabacterium cuenoti]|uniref:dephospho-CoA kinase n=1 Tax=Blattabacterium cuenoti TaxID=1653831 RepID=UPI00163C35AC|nr:dephospho-CoA kinase [Blattabacterium cuenoti]
MKKSTYLIGITGQIGTGKSLLSHYFQQMQVPVYQSDIQCKKLMNNNCFIKKEIIKYFGTQAYIKNNTINSVVISNIVFNNNPASYLKLLCKIIYPWMVLDFKIWQNYHHKKLYLIKDSALLFESGSYKNCDLMINITSSIDTIIKRVRKRSRLHVNQIINRLKLQIPNRYRIKYSNFIINNESDINYLKYKAKTIHNLIINKLKYGKR